jgi:hypothetical protein
MGQKSTEFGRKMVQKLDSLEILWHFNGNPWNFQRIQFLDHFPSKLRQFATLRRSGSPKYNKNDSLASQSPSEITTKPLYSYYSSSFWVFGCQLYSKQAHNWYHNIRMAVSSESYFILHLKLENL